LNLFLQMVNLIQTSKLAEMMHSSPIVGKSSKHLLAEVSKRTAMGIDFDVSLPLADAFIPTYTLKPRCSFPRPLVARVLRYSSKSQICPSVIQPIMVPMVNPHCRIGNTQNETMHPKISAGLVAAATPCVRVVALTSFVPYRVPPIHVKNLKLFRIDDGELALGKRDELECLSGRGRLYFRHGLAPCKRVVFRKAGFAPGFPHYDRCTDVCQANRRRMMQVKGAKPPMNLTEQVTVFVATIGDKANFDHCIQALDGQDSRFRFDTVDHVAPMSAAFQAMIDRCETPYYVQVDEDMILEPYAIRILHDAMTKAPPSTAIVCYSLWDEHMRKAILGVKIYRHDVLKRFPYNHNVPHCDVEQNERLKAAGYTIQSCWHGYERNITCIGRHGCHYTPETAYEAYYNRAAKSRLFPQWMSWCRCLAATFRRRVESDPKNLIDLYALLGFTAGLTTDLGRLDHEKDWQAINHDFRRVQADMETDLPSQLNLHVTSKCNLACQWCPRQSHPQKPDMQAQMLVKALEICPSIRSVCIAGFGEPLLCSHLAEIVTAAKRHNLFVGLITNGVLLEDFAKVLHAWGVDSVSVSLNAATAENHKACNGSDTWDRVLAGITEANRLMPGRVAVSMVCHRDNVVEMPAFLELAARLDVRTVDFLTVLPCETGQSFLTIAEDQQPDLDAVVLHQEAPRVRTWPIVIKPEKCPRACRSPYESISLDAEGFVSPCRRVMPPSEKFGRLDHATPPWRFPEWYNVRAALEGDRDLPDVCTKCFGNWTG